MNVSVNYTDASGKARSLPLLPLLGTSAWTPSLPVLFLANIQSILSSNGQTWVSFTFSPTAGGHWQLDDSTSTRSSTSSSIRLAGPAGSRAVTLAAAPAALSG